MDSKTNLEEMATSGNNPVPRTLEPEENERAARALAENIFQLKGLRELDNLFHHLISDPSYPGIGRVNHRRILLLVYTHFADLFCESFFEHFDPEDPLSEPVNKVFWRSTDLKNHLVDLGNAILGSYYIQFTCEEQLQFRLYDRPLEEPELTFFKPSVLVSVVPSVLLDDPEAGEGDEDEVASDVTAVEGQDESPSSESEETTFSIREAIIVQFIHNFSKSLIEGYLLYEKTLLPILPIIFIKPVSQKAIGVIYSPNGVFLTPWLSTIEEIIRLFASLPRWHLAFQLANDGQRQITIKGEALCRRGVFGSRSCVKKCEQGDLEPYFQAPPFKLAVPPFDEEEGGVAEEMALSCSLSPPTSYLPIPSLSTINAGFWYLLGSRTTPPPVIVKTTWLAREELENEIGMFKAARGKFGLGQLKAFNVAPIYETNWIVPDRYMNFEHLQGYTMNDCAWRAGEVDYRFQSMLDGETRIPSSKVFSQMFFDWEGRRLETAKGPKELFVAMGHALVGHAIAYQHNWFHCDVSLTNILIAVSRRKDLEVDFDTEDEHLLKLLSMQKDCRGILIDGNKALRLDSEERYTGAAVNCWRGTMIYQSTRLAYVAEDDSRDAFFSSIDDLESFIWVLIYIYFQLHPPPLPSTDVEENSSSLLLKTSRAKMIVFNQDCRMSASNKYKFLRSFGERGNKYQFPDLGCFESIVEKLCRVAWNMHQQLRRLENHQRFREQLCALEKSAYEDYLKVFLDPTLIARLPTTWDF